MTVRPIMYIRIMYMPVCCMKKEFTPMHSLSTGLSMNYDGFDENLVQYAGGESVRHAYDRTEVVPGAYAQYTFNLNIN